jgi:hypothetical protein
MAATAVQAALLAWRAALSRRLCRWVAFYVAAAPTGNDDSNHRLDETPYRELEQQ